MGKFRDLTGITFGSWSVLARADNRYGATAFWLWTKFLEQDGRRQSISEWAEELGISRRTLLSRCRLGWSAERVLGRPVGRWSE